MYGMLVKWKSLSRVSLLPRGLCPWNSPGEVTGVGSRSLLQGIFPNQGSNPGLPHCMQFLYQLSHQWRPWYVKCIVIKLLQNNKSKKESLFVRKMFIWFIWAKDALFLPLLPKEFEHGKTNRSGFNFWKCVLRKKDEGCGASLLAQMVKNPLAMQETWVWSLGREDALKKEVATHSSILAWRISWTEETGGLQSTGSQRVRHHWVTKQINNNNKGIFFKR